MATSAGVGRSSKRDPGLAGHEAAEQASRALGDSAPSLCLVYATSGYDQEALIASIRESFPGARLSGCSGEGVIAGPISDESEHAVAVLAICSDTLDFQTFLIRNYSSDPAAAGRELARQVREVSRGDEIGLLLFPDGLLGNCADLLHALDESLAFSLPITGGAAGDALIFQRTYQYHDGEAVSDAVAVVLVRGQGRMELAVSHGCTPIGLERRVTRADGGWMHEIDGRPAWHVFREYLDGEPEDLTSEGAVHLSVGESLPDGAASDDEPFVIHTPLGLDKVTGAMFFPGGGLRSGGVIRLTRRDPRKIRDSARACATRIAARHPGRPPSFVLQFDCAGRGRQLFSSGVAEQIVKPLQEVLGAATPWLGFHTYGEIAPIGRTTYYHNFTVALVAIYTGE